MKIFKLLFCSFWVAIPLLAIYAIACAIATFVENDYGTAFAKSVVYDTWWFNFIHAYLFVVLIGTLIVSKAWSRKKYSSILFHSSLIVIIFGAGVTRFFGFEGTMHIREGQSTSIIKSADSSINITAVSLDGKIQKVFFKNPIFSHFSCKSDEVSKEPLLGYPKKSVKIFGKPLELKFIAACKTTQDKNNNTSYLVVEATYDGVSKTYNIVGGPGIQSADVQLSFGDTLISMNWGVKNIHLPFALKLNKFDLERYPGSNSPSSYASEVEILDTQGNIIMPYKIYMNHVLDYDGYRFFQSSYDMDEKGTILSVNKDPGKRPTYIGYGMLILGAIWMLFAREGRFKKLAKFLQSQKIAGFALVILLSMGSGLYAQEGKIDTHGSANSQTLPNSSSINSSNMQNDLFYKLPKEQILQRFKNLKENSLAHTRKFSQLQLQDFGGRIKPVDTVAMDIVHKITKSDGFKGLSNDQVFLGMMLYPDDWREIKIIYTKTPKIREILGTPSNEKYISFNDVFDSNGYKLQNYVEEANRKKPNERSTFDNDILQVDERVNLAFMVFTGQVLKIFPDQNSHKWLAPLEAMEHSSPSVAKEIQSILNDIYTGFDLGIEKNEWKNADIALDRLAKYQQVYGKDLYLTKTKVDSEIFLNHMNFFNKLTLPYIILGVVLFIAVLVSILRDKPINIWFARATYTLMLICVGIHSIGLILRWYVSGHSPWSNAYESMLYIAWAAGIAGVIFFRKSKLALSAASFLAGIALFVANLGFMDPQIGNLVPVLKSYWLNIHVSIITASYGFLGLCFILGVITLVMFIFRNPKHPNLDSTILSLNAINEMSMILGLLMLTVGNFLGGIWANESWGRYWGWDPKETWALISIGVYAIILHLRFLKFRFMPYVFATSSVIGFYSILMTYFGVNYYLSGMHSYAAGDPVPIPVFLYYFIALTIILIVLASLKRKLEMPKI
ncbi:cytochrome c biogenesis protein [Helicobacter cappadocius]|uniref:Cytochrome c biogenesis protein CcsA n=1 Tax=Helicobacter cappadocius TaxID=3063998 RepID=A0AA90PTD5_9HELI|nr:MULTISPECIES: cytochrome c biogenesis protein CcsA [unclassified Helicobacter]MDO7253250.1 cytochrome c biogenesis protein CcsA [Helicobacter sp. faydin-H75]MDP2539174.1 cytochrome c biogenesis protein CcsA [Helicobacter sp. faydin-H76]